jgi:hypothetical protein
VVRPDVNLGTIAHGNMMISFFDSGDVTAHLLAHGGFGV